MGYNFKGFFVKCDAKTAKILIKAALKKWPDTKAKVIKEPFVGIGVFMPDLRKKVHNLTEELHEKLLVTMDSVGEDLPAWSKKYPGVVFAYIEADCFGGTCMYEGYICQNGKIKYKVKSAKDSLRKLMDKLGVTLNKNQFFKPFTRGYFDKKGFIQAVKDKLFFRNI